MRILDQYLSKQISRAILFVLLVFLALFGFFDLMDELRFVGRGNYQLQHALLYVLGYLPNYAYELFPIAVLIGSIYCLAQLAARSEFTVMRASGLSMRNVLFLFFKIGLALVFCTYIIGECLAPISSEAVNKMRTRLQSNGQGSGYLQKLNSGLWIKDNDASDLKASMRFINIGQVSKNGASQVENIRIYEFDKQMILQRFLLAKRAQYVDVNTDGHGTQHEWDLFDVEQTLIRADAQVEFPETLTQQKFAQLKWHSSLTPQILSVQLLEPEHLNVFRLFNYIQYLQNNQQDSYPYQVNLAKKIIYPLGIFVMLLMALPFAYLHHRNRGTSFKIFCGVMLGIAFHLLNNLFTHWGMLNHWPAFLVVSLPSLFFLGLALFLLRWMK